MTLARKNWMDSGAFSAFTQGVTYDVGAYCAFLHRDAKHIEYAAVLDVIGSPEKTYENQLEMERQGCHPIPCYHYGEDPKWLIKYLDKYEYIALGGMVPISKPQLFHWLDDLWSKYLTLHDGTPRARVHGFGLTTFSLMERYPWFSVDSSSWIQKGAYGLIVLLDDHGSVFTVAVSHQSPSKDEAGKHYFTETPANRAAIDRILKTYGFTADELAENHHLRRLLSAMTYQRFAETKCQYKKFVLPNVDLLAGLAAPKVAGNVRAAKGWPSTELYLANEISVFIEGELYERKFNRMYTYHQLHKRDSTCWWARKFTRNHGRFPTEKELEAR